MAKTDAAVEHFRLLQLQLRGLLRERNDVFDWFRSQGFKKEGVQRALDYADARVGSLDDYVDPVQDQRPAGFGQKPNSGESGPSTVPNSGEVNGQTVDGQGRLIKDLTIRSGRLDGPGPNAGAPVVACPEYWFTDSCMSATACGFSHTDFGMLHEDERFGALLKDPQVTTPVETWDFLLGKNPDHPAAKMLKDRCLQLKAEGHEAYRDRNF